MSIKGESRTELYRRLARRNLASLLRYKFIYEYGYDKGEVVAGAIVADICETIRCYYARPGDLEPGQVRYPAPAATERPATARPWPAPAWSRSFSPWWRKKMSKPWWRR